MSNFIFKLLFIFFFILLNFCYANTKTPIDILKNINEDILVIVDKNSDLDVDKLNEVLGDYIVSYINFNEMCSWIVGKNIWKNVPCDKKDEFIKEFQKLVIRTYSATLSKYIKSKVVFFSNEKFDQKFFKEDSKVQVSSEIELIENGKILKVDYRFIFSHDVWLLYDLIIEGVSILKGFQAQFSGDVKKNGIEFVINRIKKHNS